MKTAHKNPINGLAPTSMSAIGLIIKSTASASNTTRMEISTKEDGRITKDTVKAHTGLLTLKINSEESTQAIGSLIKNKAEAPCSTSLETGTMVCGWTTSPMEREEWSTKTAMFIKACGSKEKEAVTESLLKGVGTISKDIGSMIRGKAKALTISQRRTRSLSDNGWQILQRQVCTLKFKIQLRLKYNGKNTSLIRTFCLLLTRLAWRIQPKYCKSPYKKWDEIEQPTEQSTFL